MIWNTEGEGSRGCCKGHHRLMELVGKGWKVGVNLT